MGCGEKFGNFIDNLGEKSDRVQGWDASLEGKLKGKPGGFTRQIIIFVIHICFCITYLTYGQFIYCDQFGCRERAGLATVADAIRQTAAGTGMILGLLGIFVCWIEKPKLAMYWISIFEFLILVVTVVSFLLEVIQACIITGLPLETKLSPYIKLIISSVVMLLASAFQYFVARMSYVTYYQELDGKTKEPKMYM